MKYENRIRPIQNISAISPSKSVQTYLCNFKEEPEGGIYIFYIEGPDEEIIVDAGGSAELLNKRGYRATQIQDYREALSNVGTDVESIDKVILTHLHHDHCWYANRFPNAKIIVQRSELAEAMMPHPIQRSLYEPIKEVIDEVEFEIIEGPMKISDGVKVIPTPGHSVGGQSVIVETKAGNAIITGFCCIDDNFNPPEGFGEIIIPGIHINPKEAYSSMLRVKNEADIIIPLHEKRFSEVEVIPNDETSLSSQ